MVFLFFNILENEFDEMKDIIEYKNYFLNDNLQCR